MKLLRLLVMVAVLFSGCSPENRDNLEDQNIKRSILAVLTKQENDWNSGSIEKYMEGYLRSDSTRFASGGNVSFGWHSMLERYRKGYPDRMTMGSLKFSEIDISILSNDAALVFGKWMLTREQDTPWGYFTLLFRHASEGWKIVHDHTSSAREK